MAPRVDSVRGRWATWRHRSPGAPAGGASRCRHGVQRHHAGRPGSTAGAWATMGTTHRQSGRSDTSTNRPAAIVTVALGLLVGDHVPSLSCPTASFCMGVGTESTAAGTNGMSVPPHDGSWSAPVILEPRSASASAQLGAVSGPSASSCTAVDAGGRALEYVGGRWLPPIAVDPGGDLSAVSCLATDSLGHEITWDGKGWSLPATVDQVGSSAQSCASAVLRGDRRTGRCRPAGAGPMVTRTPAHTRAVTPAHTRAGDRDLARRATALLPTACPRFFCTSYPVRRTPPRSHRGAARPADA